MVCININILNAVYVATKTKIIQIIHRKILQEVGIRKFIYVLKKFVNDCQAESYRT